MGFPARYEQIRKKHFAKVPKGAKFPAYKAAAAAAGREYRGERGATKRNPEPALPFVGRKPGLGKILLIGAGLYFVSKMLAPKPITPTGG